MPILKKGAFKFGFSQHFSCRQPDFLSDCHVISV